MNTKAQQTRDYVLKAIRCGKWQSGDRLPSERDLAKTMGQSPLTIRRGLADLVERGVIVKKQGSGNYVADPAQAVQVAVVFPSYLLSNTVRQPAVSLEMKGLEQILDRHRYALSMMWYRPEHFWEDAGELILSRGIKGAVLWGHHLLQMQLLQKLLDGGVKVVGRTSHLQFRRLGISTFDLDRSAVLAEALSGLADRGHKNVAVVRYVNSDEQISHRLDEPEMAPTLEARVDVMDIFCMAKYELADYSNLDHIFSGQQFPTAVIVPDEVTISELFRRCYAKGIHIPNDLSVVALSDTTPHSHAVSLSAPDSIYWIDELSGRAGGHLEKLLQDTQLPGINTLINTPIKWSESTLPLCESSSYKKDLNVEQMSDAEVAPEELSFNHVTGEL